MKNTLLNILVCLFVVGCGIAPQRPENTECLQVANYARTVATLKEMGIKQHEIDQFTQVPIALTFPYQGVQDEVYYTNAKTPAHVFAEFYDKCDLNGYNSLLSTLSSDRQKRLKEQNDALLNLKPTLKIQTPVKNDHKTKRAKVPQKKKVTK